MMNRKVVTQGVDRSVVLAANNGLDRIAQGLRDDDRETFTFGEAQGWADDLGFNSERPFEVIRGLKERGLTMVERPIHKEVRTISSNSHDRWHGKGACLSHGGGGGGSIVGMGGN